MANQECSNGCSPRVLLCRTAVIVSSVLFVPFGAGIGPFAGSATAGCVAWRQNAPATSPGARFDHGMAYDSSRGRVVIFGGSQGLVGPYLDDTWEWDGTDWTEHVPLHRPSPRWGNQMAYDASRNAVVLFGGGGGTWPNDTWEWDGIDWTQRSPSNSPPPRAGHGMAYDASRNVVVLFGGMGAGGTWRNDTWEWDGTDWAQRFPAHQPSGRYFLGGNALSYDATRGVVVMFGGSQGGVSGTFLGDTWEWDGVDWVERTPVTSPPVRDGHALAYLPGSGVVLFGGNSDSVFLNDAWVWDGTNWTDVSPSAPPLVRHRHAMVFDEASGRILLFGGWNWGGGGVRGDTWELAGCQTVTYFEGFDDDLQSCRTIPNLADAALCSAFSAINEKGPGATQKLTLRDRDTLWSPGEPLFASTDLDFTDGGGSYVTFKFGVSPGDTIIGGTISFEVVRGGDDSNGLSKFVSSDGVSFTPVGTTSDAAGAYTFAAPTGTSQAYLKIQEDGNGVHIDNVAAALTLSTPATAGPKHLEITTIHRGSSNPYPGAHSFAPDTTVSISAIPYAGYQFSNWELDGADIGSANPVTVAMDSDHTLHAVYTDQDTMQSAGFWRLDEGTGLAAYDCGGNGNDGTLQGGASWVAGKFGNALEFDGVGGLVDAPDDSTLDVVRNLNIDVWFKPYVSDQLMNLVSKWGITGGNNRSYVLNIGGLPGNSDPGKVCLVLTPDGGTHYKLPSTGVVTANQWMHVIATYDGSTMALYVDGVLDTTLAIAMGPIFPGNARLQIAASESEPNSYRFNGVIDEAKVVGHAVSAPFCAITPPALAYGDVVIGQVAERSFTITNAGIGTLSGVVGEACPVFSIFSGAGGFSLGAGESRTVTVQYSPPSVGPHSCTITLGSNLCVDVQCSGQGVEPPPPPPPGVPTLGTAGLAVLLMGLIALSARIIRLGRGT